MQTEEARTSCLNAYNLVAEKQQHVQVTWIEMIGWKLAGSYSEQGLIQVFFSSDAIIAFLN